MNYMDGERERERDYSFLWIMNSKNTGCHLCHHVERLSLRNKVAIEKSKVVGEKNRKL